MVEKGIHIRQDKALGIKGLFEMSHGLFLREGAQT